MSACLSPSWIANQIGDILNGKKRSMLKSNSKTVQVVGCLNNFRSLIINDKNNMILLHLTPKCYDDLMEKSNIDNLSNLNKTIITIKKFYFSTIYHCFSDQNFDQLIANKNYFPFIIQCDNITPLGGYDLAMIEQPDHINSSSIVLNFVEENDNDLLTFTNKLVASQFSTFGYLPDCCKHIHLYHPISFFFINNLF
jgi:hypothetical protein